MTCFNCSHNLIAQNKDLYYCPACPTHFTINSHASILDQYYLQYKQEWILAGSFVNKHTTILLPTDTTFAYIQENKQYSPCITLPFHPISLSNYGQQAINLCNQYLPLKAFS